MFPFRIIIVKGLSIYKLPPKFSFPNFITQSLSQMHEINPLFEKIITELSERNFSIIRNFFDEETLEGLHQRLLERIAEGNLHTAGTGNRILHSVNSNVRSDKILWMDDQPSELSEKKFLERIEELSEYLNHTCFTGIKGKEFHYASFEKGAFYKRHIDRFRNDDSRKFSVVTYLNKNWKEDEGGELVLYIQESEVKIQPEFGITVIFRSHEVEHEVLPAGRDRLSVTGWLK
jgi:SM-20-related protein